MRSKYLWIVLSVAVAAAAVVVVVFAGDPDNPPGPPETTSSYTLEDIYRRLDTGAAGTPITFTEPIGGPGTGTMHTLNEIYDLTGERAPVPKTGQTGCYDINGVSVSCTGTGQDGEYQKGVTWPSPRFITGTTGVVTDTLTGLIWLKNADCFGARSWASALSDANGLAAGDCGLSDGSSAGDWRLPNVRELQSLVVYGHCAPPLPSGHPFTGVQSDGYWSSTTYVGDTIAAWNVSLDVGDVNGDWKMNTNYVWPVRGGQ